MAEEKVDQEIEVTEEGFQKLTDELDYLTTVKRVEVKEAIKVAKSFGDLSENSEYDEARMEQAKTESRINELTEMLKHVKVVSKKDVKSGTAGLGTTVKVLDITHREEITYTIVGSTESDPLNNFISNVSPIGKALVGSRTGDTVKVETPNGKSYKLKILRVSKTK